MPIYSKSLMKLTFYLAAAASVEYPIEVSTIATHTGISGSNIRLLLNQHSDMFHSTRVGNVNCYFLVPNEKAQRILTAATRANVEDISGLAYPQSTSMVPTHNPIPNPVSNPVNNSVSNTPPVAEDPTLTKYKQLGMEELVQAVLDGWNRTAPYENTNVAQLTQSTWVLRALIELIEDRIRELTQL